MHKELEQFNNIKINIRIIMSCIILDPKLTMIENLMTHILPLCTFLKKEKFGNPQVPVESIYEFYYEIEAPFHIVSNTHAILQHLSAIWKFDLLLEKPLKK